MDYSQLVESYEELEQTTKRLEKTEIVSRLLNKINKKDIKQVILLLQGKIFPDWDSRVLGVAARLVLKALAVSTGISQDRIEHDWKHTGDLGITAYNMITNKEQNTLFAIHLTVDKVFENLKKLSTLEGLGTVDMKIKLISELLTSAKPTEAKYIVRNLLGDLRVGVGEGVLRDAICWTYFPNVPILFNQSEKEIYNFININKFQDDINILNSNYSIIADEKDARIAYNYMIELLQEAYDLTNDFPLVAETILEKGIIGLKDIQLKPTIPIKVMLAQKAEDISAGFEKVGKPCGIEYKYDGFRMQVHKLGNEVSLFTRRLENVTNQFPELIPFVREIKANNIILDGEAVGYDPETKKYKPFQYVSQRIKRKYDIEKIADKLPVELNIFDIIYIDGKNCIKLPFCERRKLLEENIIEETKKIVLAKNIVTDNEDEANLFYQDSLSQGFEGIMMKNLEAKYKPGSRVGFWIKVKPVMETLDLAIVGAEWGEGKRKGWFTSFTIACQDEDGNLLEIGKVGTGIKELETEENRPEDVTFNQLTELLTPLIISEKGKEVKVRPEIILEINYEEIQKSPSYSSGFALRFPRVIKIRDDLGEPSLISRIYDLFDGQTKQ